MGVVSEAVIVHLRPLFVDLLEGAVFLNDAVLAGKLKYGAQNYISIPILCEEPNF
jgi:hypothetical protein